MPRIPFRPRRPAGALALALGLAFAGGHSTPSGLRSLIAPTAHAAMATFTVNSTADSDDGACTNAPQGCTLREALSAANASSGLDTITFDIPGAGVRTITPTSPLPTVTDPVIIDGYTQPGASQNTSASGNNAVLLVELNGSALGAPGGLLQRGLVITVGACVVRGLVINRFTGSAINLQTSGNNLITGNFIGLTADGAGRAGNGDGVTIALGSSNNQIGGASPAARNVISGNSSYGIWILATQSAPLRNIIQGNFIGTDASGTKAIGNNSHGISASSSTNVIGGTAPGERNVISGNLDAGIFLSNLQSGAGNTVQGNFIGTDATGASALGNFFGVWINFSNNNTVGGAAATAGNVISGNMNGVLITSDLSRNNQVGGNLIGTDATGTRAVGNTWNGVEITDSANGNGVQPLGTNAPPNTIAFNGGSGVVIGPTSRNNAVRRNHIFSNGGLGIDLNGDSVTPNDAGDDDPGGNDSQNFPVITSVVSNGATTTVQGTLNSKPNTTYFIDLFTNSACDSSGNGEGARVFGGASAVTDAGGNASFTANIPAALPAGRVVTATANDSTNLSRNTSEFSPCSTAGAAGQVEFSTTGYAVIEDIGSFEVTVVRTGGSSGPLTIAVETDGTATAGADYTPLPSTLTFADGETSKTFSIQVVSDGVTEPDETARFFLTDPSNPDAAGQRSVFTLKILDASKQPALSISDATTVEPLTGTTFAVFTISLSAATGRTVSVDFATANFTATAGVDYQAASGTLTFAPNEVSKTVTVNINSDLQTEDDERFSVNLFNPFNATVADGLGVGLILDNKTPVLEFAASEFSAAEGEHAVVITVNRRNFIGGVVTVEYATSDGTASERKDYTTAVGRLYFDSGETSKSFVVLITDDRFDDDGESFQVTLSRPFGAAILSPTTSVSIADNDAASGPSPVKDASIDVPFFVRQHYADFLNRVPDQAGLDFWVGRATGCGQSDLLVCRINVSAAFFLSIENQETGYLTHRAYKVAYGNLTGKPVPLTFREYLAGSRQIGDGVQVGVGNWQQRLEANKELFFNEFVLTPRFGAVYVGTTTEQFVDALNANAGGALSQAERDALVNALNAGTMSSPQALRAVAEDADFAQGPEKNRAFVLAQYFGYLRRNPDDIGFNGQPDPNFEGYNFWLGRLSQFNGNFVQAEMVKAFIQSIEYGERFGQ